MKTTISAVAFAVAFGVSGCAWFQSHPEAGDKAKQIAAECTTEVVKKAIADALCGVKSPPAEYAQTVARCLAEQGAKALEDAACPIPAPAPAPAPDGGK